MPFPIPGDLPDPGIEPASVMSPALAGEFFTTSTTWEALEAHQNWFVFLLLVVLEKTPESPLDCKEIQTVHSEDQPWDFFGRNDAKAETPVLWPPHAKS